MSVRTKVVKALNKCAVIEDDFGFSVVRAITLLPWTRGDLEHFGQLLNLPNQINRETTDTGLDYADAELLATRIDQAWVILEPGKSKRKRKS